jgi:hypothetical protein
MTALLSWLGGHFFFLKSDITNIPKAIINIIASYVVIGLTPFREFG